MTNVAFDPTDHGHFAAVNGIEMYYIDYGEGDPVVLLHGGTNTAAGSWNPYIPSLSRKFRIIAPDLRGHGRTNNPQGKFRYDLMADDIAALIVELGLKQPSICGWSDGAQIALELAMRYPELARVIIPGAAAIDFSESNFQMLAGWGFEGPGQVNIDQIQRVTPEFVEMLREIHSPQGSEYWQDLLTGISTMWLTPLDYTNEDFRKISAMMLILIGDQDQFISVEDTVAMYRLIPNAELAVVPNADHALPRTKVDVFAGIILEFLSRKNTHPKST